jgi:tellurite resistance protein
MSEPSLANLTEEKLEAVIETMLLAAWSDGEFTDEERGEFAGTVGTIAAGRLAGQKLGQLISRLEDAVRNEGRDARLSAVRARLTTPEERQLALSLAIKIIAADGVLRTSERELVFDTAEALEVDRDLAADLVAAASK